MPPKFILPPGIKTQSPSKKRRKTASQNTSARNARQTPHSQLLVAPPLLHANDIASSQSSTTSRHVSNGYQQRQPLKRSWEDNMIPIDVLQQPAAFSKEPTTHTHYYSGDTVEGSNGPMSTTETVVKIPQSTPFNTAYPLGLNSKNEQLERKKVPISEFSRRFGGGLGTYEVYSCQSSTVPGPERPSLADTISNQSEEASTVQRPRFRKISEVAKRFILPRANTNDIKSKKNKMKFVPPLVRGGYAERLTELMVYHKSEYHIWANATLRPVKIVGSTEPVAIVIIKAIYRDHKVQWARCIVRPNDNNKSPFDKESLKKLGEDQRRLANESVESAAAQEHSKSIETGNELSQHEDEDSISGLHMDMDGLIVRTGCSDSNKGNNDKSHLNKRVLDDPTLTIIQEEDDSSYPLQVLDSSQRSVDDENVAEKFDRAEEVGLSGRFLPGPAEYLDLSCVRDSTARSHAESNDEIVDNEATVPDRGFCSKRTVSTISSIDDRSSASEEIQASTAFHAREICTNDQTNYTPIVSMDPIPQGDIEVESEVEFVIAFSNLFNWSILKVSDRVEIYEPCRQVAVSGPQAFLYGGSVWIVERFNRL
ncbi:hypothetical protein BG011_002756 [Mortierella polycephala]|uniref:Uncharacterized protein n=1 Tax=Mortierella polycephala TaxID=41804 RepID=A0A9P6Q2L3_9FUNG|nr:hypothetical protein BG011_002756 [Mortierella polycephala]